MKNKKNTVIVIDNNNENFIEQIDSYAKECYCEVKAIYFCRQSAAKRLKYIEFWIQTVNIYYSIFTAILAVFSLTQHSEFLQIPSVLFTIVVAILVTYANAQRCGSRSKDLAANCIDLGKIYTEIIAFINSYEYKYKDCGSHEKLEEKMKKFYSCLGDSEEHGIMDRWKYINSYLFYVYIAGIIIFISLLFIIPIGFVWLYRKEFVEIFKTIIFQIS